MRKLASIQKILDIQPIPGADAIEVATINSWKVVVKKDEFAVGDLVVYFEIDSWIPHTLAPFLSKGQYPKVYDGIEGERLRTVRLRGQVSQGLIIDLATARGYAEMLYGEGHPFEMATFRFDHTPVGTDVSDDLGILKYDPPVSAQLAGISRGAFPSYFPKTDEERIQNLTGQWPDLREQEYEVTEKLEGSSMSVGVLEGDDRASDGDFIVCSRNLNLKETEGNTLWALARKYDIERKLREVDPRGGFILQGEIVGEGVQGNHYGIKGQDFYVFAVYDIGMGRYYFPEERRRMCERLGLKHVPVLDTNVSLAGLSIEDMLARADGMSMVNPTKKREGLVYKRADGAGDQEHFKVVSNMYLLESKN